MQIFDHQLIRVPILSLQTGQQIAFTTGLVIDPATLKIAALLCQGATREPLVVLPQDIRQAGAQGLIVDSDEALTEPTDIVRLRPLVERPFVLVGLPVITQLGRKVGKVESFTINPEQYQLQKLYVHRPLLQSLLGDSAIIDRSQIVDITRTQITVKDTEATASKLANSPLANQTRAPLQIQLENQRPQDTN